jgi:hypothetical protein
MKSERDMRSCHHWIEIKDLNISKDLQLVLAGSKIMNLTARKFSKV